MRTLLLFISSIVFFVFTSFYIHIKLYFFNTKKEKKTKKCEISLVFEMTHLQAQVRNWIDERMWKKCTRNIRDCVCFVIYSLSWIKIDGWTSDLLRNKVHGAFLLRKFIQVYPDEDVSDVSHSEKAQGRKNSANPDAGSRFLHNTNIPRLCVICFRACLTSMRLVRECYWA